MRTRDLESGREEIYVCSVRHDLRCPSRAVSLYLSQYIFDPSEQSASAECRREREKLLDCAMTFQPLIFDKTPYDEYWQPMLFGS